MHNHVKIGGAFVIQPAISHFTLPAVHDGVEQIIFQIISKACIFQILVQLLLLSGFIFGRFEFPGAYFPYAYKQNETKYQNACYA